jgi:predicted metal-dependent phosphoesterase TrpH
MSDGTASPRLHDPDADRHTGVPPQARTGRADLHIHSLASDGTSGVAEIIDHAELRTDLDVIAITDHERIDAAVAARAMARSRGYRIGVIVGEEVSTRGGHLLALFIERPIPPLLSLRESIARIHDQGGIAIPAHPLAPFPLCASAGAIRRLLADPDPAVRPDALEVLNPTAPGRLWHGRLIDFAAETGLARTGSSDAHAAAQIGQGYTTFPGHTIDDLRRALEAGTTEWHGEFYPAITIVETFLRQLEKWGRDVRDEVGGRLGRERTGRDLGYPGGRRRPASFDERELRP